MDLINLFGTALMCAAASVAVNASSTPFPLATVAAKPTLKLTTAIAGCRSRSLTNPQMFQASPPERDRRRDDAHPERRLQIRGGLFPSATIAAQAGALDPGRGAETAAGGSAAIGRVPMPDVSIERVATTTARPKPERCR